MLDYSFIDIQVKKEERVIKIIQQYPMAIQMEGGKKKRKRGGEKQ